LSERNKGLDWQLRPEVLGSAELSIADFAGQEQHLRQLEYSSQYIVL
jgi:hypothetical protein